MGIMDGYRDMLAREVDRSRSELQRLAQHISERTAMIAGQLAEGDTTISEIGELQGSGPRFDVACATYTRAARALKDYDAFVAASQEHSNA